MKLSEVVNHFLTDCEIRGLSGAAAPALGSDDGQLVPARNVVQEVLDLDEYREWLDRQSNKHK